MRFYQKEHKYYCGIDLHARSMYVCIVNRRGKILYHRNLDTNPEILFNIIFPYLDDVVVCWAQRLSIEKPFHELLCDFWIYFLYGFRNRSKTFCRSNSRKSTTQKT